MKKEIKINVFVFITILICFIGVIIFLFYASFLKTKSNSSGEIIRGCNYLSNITKDKIISLLYDGETVALREREEVYEEDYLVTGGGKLYEVIEISNDTAGQWADNQILLEDVFSEFIFEVVFSSDSTGEILIDNIFYNITMHCYSEAGPCTMRMDFPQTLGNDLLSFENCICNTINSYCITNMLGNSEPIKIELGLSERNSEPIIVTNGNLECEDIGECLFGFVGIIYPGDNFFNYDNSVFFSCNSILDFDEMKSHNDWISGSRVIVQYMCIDKKFL